MHSFNKGRFLNLISQSSNEGFIRVKDEKASPKYFELEFCKKKIERVSSWRKRGQILNKLKFRVAFEFESSPISTKVNQVRYGA